MSNSRVCLAHLRETTRIAFNFFKQLTPVICVFVRLLITSVTAQITGVCGHIFCGQKVCNPEMIA